MADSDILNATLQVKMLASEKDALSKHAVSHGSKASPWSRAVLLTVVESGLSVTQLKERILSKPQRKKD